MSAADPFMLQTRVDIDLHYVICAWMQIGGV